MRGLHSARCLYRRICFAYLSQGARATVTRGAGSETGARRDAAREHFFDLSLIALTVVNAAATKLAIRTRHAVSVQSDRRQA